MDFPINEFLFEPALPIYTIDKPERYPHDRNLARELFGLKRRLEQDDSKYIEDSFSEDYESAEIGKMKITCYVFRNKIEGKTVKESRETTEREFFKNNMSVIFSVNGQVLCVSSIYNARKSNFWKISVFVLKNITHKKANELRNRRAEGTIQKNPYWRVSTHAEPELTADKPRHVQHFAHYRQRET